MNTTILTIAAIAASLLALTGLALLPLRSALPLGLGALLSASAIVWLDAQPLWLVVVGIALLGATWQARRESRSTRPPPRDRSGLPWSLSLALSLVVYAVWLALRPQDWRFVASLAVAGTYVVLASYAATWAGPRDPGTK